MSEGARPPQRAAVVLRRRSSVKLCAAAARAPAPCRSRSRRGGAGRDRSPARPSRRRRPAGGPWMLGGEAGQPVVGEEAAGVGAALAADRRLHFARWRPAGRRPRRAGCTRSRAPRPGRRSTPSVGQAGSHAGARHLEAGRAAARGRPRGRPAAATPGSAQLACAPKRTSPSADPASTRFIAGEPMKAPTKTLAGRSKSSCGRRALLDHAVAQHRHPVAQRHRLDLIVGDVDGGRRQPLVQPRRARRACWSAASRRGSRAARP